MILAIDLAQSKSVSCEFDTVNGDFRVKTFDTTGAVVRKLSEKSQADQVVIEICPLAARRNAVPPGVHTEGGVDNGQCLRARRCV